MYHISPDKRAEKSAMLLCRALNAMLLRRPLADISVSDLQRASSVGRSTFYRLFDNIPDLLNYQCERLFENALKAYPDRDTTAPIELAEFFISQVLQEQDLLKALMVSGRPDFLLDAHRKYQDEAIAYFFPGQSLPPEQKAVFNALFAALLAVLVTPETGPYPDAQTVIQEVRCALARMARILE